MPNSWRRYLSQPSSAVDTAEANGNTCTMNGCVDDLDITVELKSRFGHKTRLDVAARKRVNFATTLENAFPD